MHTPFAVNARAPRPWRTPRALAAAVLLYATFQLAVAAPEPGTEPLGLDRAVDLAVARSHRTAGYDAAVTSAREMAVAARQLPDPVLSFGIDNLPVSGTDRFSLSKDFMTMRKIGVMQELTSADKRARRAEGYGRSAERTLAEKAVAVSAIKRDTAIAWLERYHLDALARLADEQVAQARQAIEAGAAAYRGGKGKQADLLAARSDLAMAEDRASDIAQRRLVVQSTLERWVGDAAARPLAGLPALDTIPLEPTRLGTQLAHHPELGVLARLVDEAAAAARTAEADRKADWSVEVAFQQRGSANANMVSVSASIPLQWDRKNRQDREVAAKAALAEQRGAELAEGRRVHAAEARALIEQWRSGRRRAERFERELQPLAAQRVQSQLAAYRGGNATLTEVLAARRNAAETSMQALQLQMDTARLWAQINFLVPRSGAHERPAAIPADGGAQ